MESACVHEAVVVIVVVVVVVVDVDVVVVIVVVAAAVAVEGSIAFSIWSASRTRRRALRDLRAHTYHHTIRTS